MRWPMTADGKVLDYFGGKKDIDQKVIRTVGKPEDRFQEDALRMLRAVRFMSQLGFRLSPETEEAIAKEKSLLSHVSVERKTIEFEKLLQEELLARRFKHSFKRDCMKSFLVFIINEKT